MKRRYFMYAMMFVCITLFSQEYLTSPIYQYYRFLELDGTLPKKSLNYYSLSNSFYLQSIDKTHIWSKYLDLSKRDSSLIQTLPLETYASYNSSYSRGFNDGALWQGKGYNLSILGGVLMKKGGFSFALAPIFWYAQNLPFSMVPVDPSHSSPYGSFIPNIDEPQRFGASPVYHIDWGESEIRYTLNNLTVGIGTQSVWIGPAFKNALILSNNAGGFPKIDVGLYPYETSIGSFEARLFVGMLKNSDYVDLNLKEKDRILLGYSLSYSPIFLPYLTIGLHRTAMTYSKTIEDILQAFSPMNLSMGFDQTDQRASLTVEWLLPSVGFSVYGEWARNDFNDTFRRLLTQLHHSQAYTIGVRQLIFSSSKYKISFLFELSQLQHTIDYQTDVNVGRGIAGFYTHHIIQQGYTHNGQLLGAAVGSGGSSQYLGIDIYTDKSKISFYTMRRVINIDYIYGQPEPRNALGGRENIEITFGTSFFLFLSKTFGIQTEAAVLWRLNMDYIPQNDLVGTTLNVLLRYTLN